MNTEYICHSCQHGRHWFCEKGVCDCRCRKGYTLIELMLGLALIGMVAVLVTGGVVAFHFIAKFW